MKGEPGRFGGSARRTARRALTSLALLGSLAASACGSSHTGASVAPLRGDAGREAGETPPVCDIPTDGLPTDLFCTGLYEGRTVGQYSALARPYTPGVTLWSDGAEKQRYLYLPPSSTIDTTDLDAWNFPVGTKAWKEFRFDGKLVETRLFWKRAEATWASGTYVWDAAQTAATLNTDRKGVILDTGYEIPTAKDCDKCHHGGADKLLGVEAVALALPTAVGVTLETLASAGSLSHPPAQTSVMLPEDATGKAGAALGYLHANCGMPCHSSRGLGEETNLVLRLRAGELWPAADGGGSAAITGAPTAASTTDAYRATLGQPPTTASVAQAFPGAKRVTPGAHDSSLVWLLPHRRGAYQMPPLVSHVVDDVGTARVSDWIDALTP